jgi:hypothetical protein
MKIRFTKIKVTPHRTFHPGWVVGVSDDMGAAFIAEGVAIQVPNDTRALKYPPAAPISAECVPTPEALDSAPKGATVLPEKKKSLSGLAKVI